MNIKKIVAFLLAAQMLLMSMAACGKEEPEETKKTETTPVTETTSTETIPAETEPAETEFDRLSVSDELPEVTFDGKDFRYIVEDKYSYQLLADEYTGDALNDVIYERNQRVENRFDIKISTLANVAMDADDYLVTFAQVGEHVAEVCAFEQNKGNTPAVYFCWANWVDVDYLNFDQPWWNKQAIEDHIINNVCYMISGLRV